MTEYIGIGMEVLFWLAAGGVAVFWGMVKIMFVQYEKRLELRFTDLAETMADQKTELDNHMAKQDVVLAEVRRVESSSLAEIRRVESELTRCRIDASDRFMTKDDAKVRHTEILDAIHSLGNRIDSLHGRGAGT